MSRIFIHRREDEGCNSTYSLSLTWDNGETKISNEAIRPLRGTINFTKKCLTEREASVKLQKSTDSINWSYETTNGLIASTLDNWNELFSLSNTDVRTSTKYRLELTNYKGEKYYSNIIEYSNIVILELEVNNDTSWVKDNQIRTGCSSCNGIKPFEFRINKTPYDYSGEVKLYAINESSGVVKEITELFIPDYRGVDYTVYTQTITNDGRTISSNRIKVSDKQEVFNIHIDFYVVQPISELVV